MSEGHHKGNPFHHGILGVEIDLFNDKKDSFWMTFNTLITSSCTILLCQ